MKTYKRKRFDNDRVSASAREDRNMLGRLIQAGMSTEDASKQIWEQKDPERAAKARWSEFLNRPGNSMFEGMNNPETQLPYEGSNYWHSLMSSVVNGTAPPDVLDYMEKLPMAADPMADAPTPGIMEEAGKYQNFQPEQVQEYEALYAMTNSRDPRVREAAQQRIRESDYFKNIYGDRHRFYSQFGMGF